MVGSANLYGLTPISGANQSGPSLGTGAREELRDLDGDSFKAATENH